LWLGTDGDGIYKTTPEGKVIKHYVASKAQGSLTNNAILSAFKDSKNNLWFGSYAGGCIAIILQATVLSITNM
jgi:ligand-binding sensor domain-containing protein